MTGMLEHLIGRLRAEAWRSEAGTLPDGELLCRWTQHRDEAAFELLVLRHGRLVLSVCRRLLGDGADVEDAFQATFLVLVRKAGGISRGQALAAWLHTVAHRVALQARARRGRDGPTLTDDVAAPEAEDNDSREVLAALDEEVRRLPEKYRVPFVLCHLEGRTNEEAARQLGRPVGTILSRLSRARERLRQRLARRGLALSAVLVPLTLPPQVPAQLVRQTVHAALAATCRGLSAGAASASAVALTEGVLRAMLSTRLKVVCAVVLSLAVLAVGGGTVSYRALQAQAPPGTPVATKLPDAEDLKRELVEAQDRVTRAQNAIDRLSEREGRRSRLGEGDPKELAEVLAVRVKMKKAELKVAQAFLEASVTRKAVQDRTLASVVRGISEDDIRAVRLAVVTAEGQFEVKKAELEESELLLMQASRRISSAGDSPAAPRPLEKRVQDMEKRILDLEKQVERLSGGRR